MNQLLTSEEKQKIIETLAQRGVNASCPMCGNKNFIMADGYFNQMMQKDFQNVTLGGPSIPTIATVCNNCGFVSQHALGVLGLLNNTEKK
jgi:hypothetical protein